MYIIEEVVLVITTITTIDETTNLNRELLN